MPDYDNQVSIGKIQSYTATKTGWVVVSYYGYSTTGIYTANVKVNNKLVNSVSMEAQAPNGARAVQGHIMIPVNVGDVVTFPNSGNENTSYFIPGKWVTPTV